MCLNFMSSMGNIITVSVVGTAPTTWRNDKTKNLMLYLLCSDRNIVISLGKSCSRRKVQGYVTNGGKKRIKEKWNLACIFVSEVQSKQNWAIGSDHNILFYNWFVFCSPFCVSLPEYKILVQAYTNQALAYQDVFSTP